MRRTALAAGAGIAVIVLGVGSACDPVDRSFDGGGAGAAGGTGAAGGAGGGGSPGMCGDGRVDPGEICEDGNTTDGDGCDSNCTPTGCGNGVVSQGETCDDGDATDGDGCDSNCTPTGCGNGIVTSGEACDDGNAIDGDGCDSNCAPTGCGNGVIDGNEGCDDGNTADGDGCDSNCTPTGCGNGIVTRGELCDRTPNCRDDCAALVFPPTDVRGIRRISGMTILLTFLAVKAGTEDRTVAEWNLRDLPPESLSVQLTFDLDDIDPGGTEGSIDISSFNGDGVVDPTDFNAGMLFERRTANMPFQTISVDVSSLVATARAQFVPALGFRFSTVSSDRYDLDQGGARPPRLEVLSLTGP